MNNNILVCIHYGSKAYSRACVNLIANSSKNMREGETEGKESSSDRPYQRNRKRNKPYL